MAERRSRSRSRSSNRGGRRRKSEAEARVERMTWFLLVLIFAAISLLPEGSMPNALVPFAGALVLLGSGLYQYSHRWRVSPVTWVVGSIMMVIGLYSIYVNQTVDLLPHSLVAFAIVIGFGVVTGET
jgi:uncharacterized membrane protein